MTNSIEVEVPHEIMDYQSKVMFGLTLRQFLASLLILVLVVPTYVVLITLVDINNQIANMIIMVMSAPILAYGFIQKDGFTFSQIVKTKRDYHNSYKKRSYQIEPLKREKFKYQKSKEKELKNHTIQTQKRQSRQNRQRKQNKQRKQRKLARKSIKSAKKEQRKAIKECR